MHIEVFDTTESSQYQALQALVARDGKDIHVDKIYTAAAANGNQYNRENWHWVTVVYFTLDVAPPQG
jgi:N-formylglutamate amidohydrolase